MAAASLVAVGGVSQSHGARSLSDVERRAQAAREREGVLTTDVSRFNARIRAVQVRLAPVQARWNVLNNELIVLRTRRRTLSAQLDAETARLTKLVAKLKRQRVTLAKRISIAYRVGSPTTLEVLLRSGSLSDAASMRENLQRVTDQDKGLIVATRTNANESRSTAAGIKTTRNEVYRNEQRAGVAEAEAARTLSVIATEKNNLVVARAARGPRCCLGCAKTAGSSRKMHVDCAPALPSSPRKSEPDRSIFRRPSGSVAVASSRGRSTAS